MRRLRLPFLLAVALAACRPALAQDTPQWSGAPDCRIAGFESKPARSPSWNGGCKDGYADGKGVVEWRDDKDKPLKLEATMKAGRIEGEATLRYPDGTLYIGTVVQGIPDGRGYFRWTDGSQYEGDVRRAEIEGNGHMLFETGNDYNGQWKDGKRHGTGTETFILGGRYEGGWADDKPSGAGKIVYAGTPRREAAAVDGRVLDSATTPAAEPDKKYTVKHDIASLGSVTRPDAARGVNVPPALGYEQLSPEQQARLKNSYPALAPGDEPPYPVHGPAEFFKAVSILTGTLQQSGTIYLYVLVDKTGKVSNVTAIGLNDPEARKLLGTAAALVKYKPARCAGEPCDMVYGYNLALTLRL